MFFSVKSPVKIAGKVYTPCVCYALDDFLTATVEKMVKEDKARVYDHKVFFQNGKVIEKKKEDTCEECSNNLGGGICTGDSNNGLVDTTGELKCFEKKGKKAKKEKEIPSPEEIADNIEDF